jgi:hypothetical protein
MRLSHNNAIFFLQGDDSKAFQIMAKYRIGGVEQMKIRYKVYNLLFLIFVLTILFSGCDKSPTTSNSGLITSKNIEECIEPNNPFNDDGGHDAGFNWAMENGRDCNGNSDSFNEGCEEYHRQLNQYNECIAKKNR